MAIVLRGARGSNTAEGVDHNLAETKSALEISRSVVHHHVGRARALTFSTSN